MNSTHDAPQPPLVTWPPPGLESAHGRVWPLIDVIAIGDLILVLPLLVAVGTQQHFASLGPFGPNWWFLIVTTGVGALILLAGLERLVRLAWSAGRAAQDGHGWLTILQVMSDGSHDMGFLIHGARQFAGFSHRERKPITYLRLATTGLYLSAVLFAPAGFMAGVLLGRAGLAGRGAVWALGIVVPMLLLLAGTGARLAAFALARAVKRPGELPRVSVMVRSEIAAWTKKSKAVLGAEGSAAGAPGKGLPFRAGAILMATIGSVVLVSSLVLALAGTIPPILATMGIPAYPVIEARLQQAEVYRPYRLDPDPAVSPQAAGEALHAIFHVGQVRELASYEHAPARTYAAPFLSDSLQRRFGTRWVIETIESGGQNLSPDDRRLVAEAAAHPAFEEFATVATAAEIDVIGTRFTELPDSVSPVTVPIPRFSSMNNGVAVLLASAMVHLTEGRTTEAERSIRLVISTGFVLLDESPTLIDNFVGARLVRDGGRALGTYLRRVGREAEADKLDAVVAQLRAATDRIRARRVRRSVESAVRSMPGIVTDSTAPLGLRWEFFLSVSTFARCNNLFTIVFGPGDEHAAWVEEARQSLVRRDSDADLFALFSRGWFGTEGCLPLIEALRSM